MDKVFRKPPSRGFAPIKHKEFNEFIKGKGFKGRNNYKLRDLILFDMGFFEPSVMMSVSQPSGPPIITLCLLLR